MGKKKNTRDVSLTYETLPALFTGICDAIRAKTGGTDLINHQDIPSAIGDIPMGSSGSTVYANKALNPAGYGSATDTFTITGAGTLTLVIMKSNSLSSPSVTLNGNTLSASYASFGDYPTWAYYTASVAVDDVIVVDTGNVGGGSANAYELAIVTPTN